MSKETAASERGITLCCVSDGESYVGGRRCLVGAIVGEYRCEIEEGVRTDLEEHEDEDDGSQRRCGLSPDYRSGYPGGRSLATC